MARDCPERRAVDESFLNRRNREPARAVESTVRVAGGNPTLGGGTTSWSPPSRALVPGKGTA